MLDLTIAQNFLVALALGILIGMEREYDRYKRKGHAYAGIRTFPLIALFGAICAYFGDTISFWILVTGIILLGGLIIAFYYSISVKSIRYLGATSEVAGFLTFFIGVLCYYGELNFAVAMAIIIAVILYSKTILHQFVQKMQAKELKSTLLFAVIAFVILPFLPNQGYGPYEIFNPYIIWLMVVFISGISFVGYFFMKWFGEKGIELAGIFGGLVSSTAVTSSFSERSKKEKKILMPLVLGVVLANGIMFVRILIEVFVINRDLFYDILWPLAILAALTAAFSFIIWRKAESVKGKIELDSPFTLGPALKFGAFFAIILALVKIADVYLSSRGVYVVSLISGLADVDAITVSLSQLSKGDLSLEIAKRGIMIAALTNIAVKGGIAVLFGSKQFGRIIAIAFAILIGLGIGLIFLF
ncbi:MAG: MgtC/SapB family protein [Nanoarchaeota archaeon]|nr:MgtC/SapB family protein [Nanoarchaeota archaeon]